MAKETYSDLLITEKEAENIMLEHFGITGKAKAQNGEFDFNFRIKTEGDSYLLKVLRPDSDELFIRFQQALLQHINQGGTLDFPPKEINHKKNGFDTYIDKNGRARILRLLHWVPGKLWSSVNPVSDSLLYDLGKKSGKLTHALNGFEHPYSKRYFTWDISSLDWVKNDLAIFNSYERKFVEYFLDLFQSKNEIYSCLRRSVIHNDINDNNILVEPQNPTHKVNAIIDFGDAIYTPTINELAVVLAYAVLGKNDPLQAARQVISGYVSEFPLEEKEIEILYSLVAARWLISLTVSGKNAIKEPENEYLQVSREPILNSIKKWYDIPENLAISHFRQAAGFAPHPKEKAFKHWASQEKAALFDLFPGHGEKGITSVDMSVSSTWLGHAYDFENDDFTSFKLNQLQKENPGSIVSGGYLETRPFYTTDAFKKEGNNGPEYRTVHLGVDFWLPAGTPVHSLWDGTVHLLKKIPYEKDYGVVLILKHEPQKDLIFYSIYGHLSHSTLDLFQEGDKVKKGQLIAYLGAYPENGNWTPHLHFQLTLDMLGNKENFPGVAFPDEKEIWSSICPDPNLFFKESNLNTNQEENAASILAKRKKKLGKSLSLSYQNPLHIVRGIGVHLMDINGRKYLDTNNNVAHIGHEHPATVKAAREQIALLNTNTRYLHKNITVFAEELLSTFPNELCVAHFVNSGSEANELALRMAKTYTGQKDIIAMEIGYHGNTGACIDVSSYKFDGKGGSGAPEHTHIVPLPDTFRGIHRGKNQGPVYANYVKQYIVDLSEKGRKPAAFLCESILSCGGQIDLPEGFLRDAFRYTKESGGLNIIDEVQVGVGRVGEAFWGFQMHGVIPDIVTIGKPIGNGHPLGAVVCTREVAEAFANGMEYFNTFGGNPVSCAIGTAVLRTVKEEGLQENALKVGNYLKEGLHSLSKTFPIIADIRGKGLFLGFEFCDADLRPLAAQASYYSNRMKEMGILTGTDGKDHNVIKIKPPMVFDRGNAYEFLVKTERILREDFMGL